MSAVKVCELFKKSKGWYGFFVEFHNYKLCGEQPAIFGRDAPLDLQDMHHIHLAGTSAIQALWASRLNPYHRTVPLSEPEHDYWLIYAHDDVRDEYLLLTITGPHAHSRAKWGAYLRTLANEIVEPWISGRVTYSDPDDDLR